jgi:hypothetical protein
LYCPAQRARGGITQRPLLVRCTELASALRATTPRGVQTDGRIESIYQNVSYGNVYELQAGALKNHGTQKKKKKKNQVLLK